MNSTDIFKDSVSESLAAVVGGCLPFITFGLLKHPLALYIASAIAGLALLGLLFRIGRILGGNRKPKKCELLHQIIFNIFVLPYPFALSCLIALCYGIDTEAGLWLSIALAVFACSPALKKVAPQGKDNNQ